MITAEVLFPKLQMVTLSKNYFLSFRQLSNCPKTSFFSSCIVFKILSFSSSTFSRFSPYSFQNTNISEAEE